MDWKKKCLFFLEPFLIIILPQCMYFGTLKHLIFPGNSGWYLLSMIWWYGLIICMKKRKIESSWGGGIP